MAMPAGLRRYWAKHRKGGKAKSSKRGTSMSKGHHKRGGFTIPVAAVMGFAPLVVGGIDNVRFHGISGLKDYTARTIIPYDPESRRFTTAYLGYGLYPIVAGFLVHWLVGGKLGVNRMLGRARVPLLRL
jgi:hypothetical protein